MPKSGLIFLLLASYIFSCSDRSTSAATQGQDRGTNTAVADTLPQKEDTAFEINATRGDIQLVPQPVHLQKGIDFELFIPEGYHISIAAENLGRLRFLARSSDGKLFATDMHNLDDNHEGKVYMLDGWDPQLKHFGKIITFLSRLHNPNQVAFHDGYLYVAETDRLSRYIYHNGDTTVTSLPEVIATFPAYGLSYKYGGWHLTRSLAFHNNKIYVSIGSSCNACIEKEEVRASILEMNPDGSGKTIYARGLRNSVGMKWVNGKLWVTSMGRDLIGPDKPEDLFQTVEKDGYYGWPFYFQYRRMVYADEQFKDSARAAWVKKPAIAFCGFKAHSAPLGFDFFSNFSDPVLNNSFLAALHGSTTVSRKRGNAVVKVVGGNTYVEVVTGFLSGDKETERHGRPCDVMKNDDHSFFITDDKNGVLYYVWKE